MNLSHFGKGRCGFDAAFGERTLQHLELGESTIDAEAVSTAAHTSNLIGRGFQSHFAV
jgi:hypothetical protein